ncbi:MULTISPECIES: hypothetical protein [unclassified Amycolatopsis]|uniref:hypothetical protein n=1 Tax=unclassified Amycolatopsis TaxID=2618356 RepID=UPI0028750C1C|nr:MULTISPECIES: hypothetical protein [unclassified Amycolatopsis]MDS0140747.1 hypothetical protein [Amycolatopsis sp. 505]MDS0149687.1 hypothetical protein [Amycolatopsis sp. CM201R]
MPEPATPPRTPETPGRPPVLPASAFGPTGIGTAAARIVPRTGDARPPETDRRVTP